MKRDRSKEVTVIEYQHGSGVRVVRGEHAISAESGVPSDIRVYGNVAQAIAAERGGIRDMLYLLGVCSLR